MTRAKRIELFYEQVSNFPRTAQGLRDALAALKWGQEDVEPIGDIYSDYCREYSINIHDPILADYLGATAEGKAKEKEAEARKRIIEHSKKYTAGELTTPDFIDNVNKEQAQIKSDRNRFAAMSNYREKCKNYDPSKDFSPSMLAGLRFIHGSLSYIGARTAVGKSTILINIAREALEAGRNVLFVNLEMSEKTIITNFALSVMYANANDKERRELSTTKEPTNRYYSLFKRQDDSRETFDYLRGNAIKKLDTLFETNLMIYDGVGATLETIISDIKSRTTDGDVVLIDYIQNMPKPKDSGDQQYVLIKKVSRTLLETAIYKNIVIISGAQFGRQGKENRGKEFDLEDFRECGDIEQDAHNALAIEKILDKDGDDIGRYVHVLKQREGGKKYTRQQLNCNFDYLFMTGIEGEYKPEKSKKDKPDNPDPRNPHGVKNP